MRITLPLLFVVLAVAAVQWWVSRDLVADSAPPLVTDTGSDTAVLATCNEWSTVSMAGTPVHISVAGSPMRLFHTDQISTALGSFSW